MTFQDFVCLISCFLLIFLVVIGCAGQPFKTKEDKKEEAVIVAQKLSITLQQKDYGAAYDLFVAELKSQRTKEDFQIFANQFFINLENPTLIYDKVVHQSDEEAYAYYSFSGGFVNQKLPPFRMIYTPDGWKFDAFAGLFMNPCAQDCEAQHRCEQAVCNRETKFLCEIEMSKNCPCERSGDCPKVSTSLGVSRGGCSKGYCDPDTTWISIPCTTDQDCPLDDPFCEEKNGKKTCTAYADCNSNADCRGDRPCCFQKADGSKSCWDEMFCR